MQIFKFLIFVYIFSFITPIFPITCLSNKSKATSWFFLLKYPRKTQQLVGQENKYAYFDISIKTSSFLLRDKFIDDSGEALFETLSQINHDKSLQVIAWNDQPADEKASSSKSAHSKGIIVYDSNQKNAIYMGHSMPKYPAFNRNGTIEIMIPTAERIYGQNVLCMSLSEDNLDKIAKGLNIIGSTIYFNSFKEKSLKNVFNFSKDESPKKLEKTLNIKFNVNKVPFVAFFKNPYFDTGFIFEDVMIPYLNSNLFVESWGRPYQASSCNKQYQCVNIRTVKIEEDNFGKWNNSGDHSKWVISQNHNWICSGDMNRMVSQAKRGGAFFCFQDKQLWIALFKAIETKDSCE